MIWFLLYVAAWVAWYWLLVRPSQTRGLGFALTALGTGLLLVGVAASWIAYVVIAALARWLNVQELIALGIYVIAWGLVILAWMRGAMLWRYIALVAGVLLLILGLIYGFYALAIYGLWRCASPQGCS